MHAGSKRQASSLVAISSHYILIKYLFEWNEHNKADIIFEYTKLLPLFMANVWIAVKLEHKYGLFYVCFLTAIVSIDHLWPGHTACGMQKRTRIKE